MATTTQQTPISDEQIRTLRDEAGSAGDSEQVAICSRALDGDDSARGECAEVIEAARQDFFPQDGRGNRSPCQIRRDDERAASDPDFARDRAIERENNQRGADQQARDHAGEV